MAALRADPEAADPPVILVPGFLAADSFWGLGRLSRRHPRVRFLPTHPGPLSSHHDRACEIFYTIKGGVVDYGAAHAAQCGHGRYGRTHAGLHAPWDEAHPCDGVGHSIGGVTLRVLQRLLEEQAFPGHRTSAAWLRSLSTVSTPHNGDLVIYGLGARAPAPSRDGAGAASWLRPGGPWLRPFSCGWLITLVAHVVSWLDLAPLSRLVPMRLEHWRFSRRHAGSLRTLLRALAWRSSMGQGWDNAAFEVGPGWAAELNRSSRAHPRCYYLSFPARRPRTLGAVRERLVAERARATTGGWRSRWWSLLLALGRELAVTLFGWLVRACSGRGRAAACAVFGFAPSAWRAHDGLISVCAQARPFGAPWKPLTSARGAALQPGVWHVMPLSLDHFTVCGGPLRDDMFADAFWDVFVLLVASLPRPESEATAPAVGPAPSPPTGEAEGVPSRRPSRADVHVLDGRYTTAPGAGEQARPRRSRRLGQARAPS